MALKKTSKPINVSRVRRPVQEEPENPYAGGGPSAGDASSGSGTGPRRPSDDPRGGILEPYEGYFPGGSYSSRTNMYPYSDARYTNYISQRPGYLKYFEEDVQAPLIAGRGNPGLIAVLQRQMAAVGLITESVPRGVWDTKTETAYRRLLELSNMWDMTDQETLNRLMVEAEGAAVDDYAGTISRRTSSDGSGEGGRGTGFRIENGQFVPEGPEAFIPGPLELQLPNPDDVSGVVRRLSIDMLGQGLPQENVNAITSAYIAEVTRLQESAYSQMVQRERELWETGTTNIDRITEVQAPSAEGFAERKMMEDNPQEYQANRGSALLTSLINQWS